MREPRTYYVQLRTRPEITGHRKRGAGLVEVRARLARDALDPRHPAYRGLARDEPWYIIGTDRDLSRTRAAELAIESYGDRTA